jgi:PAS domain S-box-containing protein
MDNGISNREPQDALMDSAEDYRTLVEHAPDAIAIHCEGKWVYVNPAGMRLFGASRPGEVLGRDVLELVPPEFREFVRERMRKSYDHGTPAPLQESRLLRVDGVVVEVEVATAPGSYKGKPATHTILRDITKRKQAERELREARDAAVREHIRLETVLDTIPSGVLAFDQARRITLRNRPAAAFFGKPLDTDSADRRIQDFRMTKPDGEPYQTSELPAMVAMRTGETIHNAEMTMTTADGRQMTTLSNAAPLRDEAGEIIGSVVAFHDITERKRAEEALQTALAELKRRTAELESVNRELEAFSYTVSCDLRTPLRSIEGFTQALLEDCVGRLDETGKDYFNRVLAASRRMGQLIEALQHMARLSRSELRAKAVDLSSLARTIVHALQRKEPLRKVECIIAGGVTAHGDADLLAVVLENLLDNAWKFTIREPGARIEFGSVAHGSGTAYFVRDNGAGFSLEFAGKLFSPFQRFHGDREYPGLGIGLAIANRIVVRHGGAIRAESEPGKGATFFFTLGST